MTTSPHSDEIADAFVALVVYHGGRTDVRWVQIDTEDGPITVHECVACGMLDPDDDPRHGCPSPQDSKP